MSETDYLNEITKNAKPFRDKEDLSSLIDIVKNKKIVMLGESTHGTKEFYEWRNIISQELISKHGFNFIAVEGDWPPCQKINRYIRGSQSEKELGSARDVLSNFQRWPTWMWANTEMIGFIDWLRDWNTQWTEKVGFHGLDLYSFYESVDEVLLQLKKTDPQLAGDAAKYYACLGPYKHDEKAYAQSLLKAPEGCKKEIAAVLAETVSRALKSGNEKDTWFDAKQNALIVNNAEHYYRAMLFGNEDSWNVRDNHMMETLKMLIEHYKHDAKAIIWAHNTHIGDYRATDMVSQKQVNIGGLAREIYGKESLALVGFATSTGTVIASHSWGGPIMTLNIPAPRQDSVEYSFHQAASHLGFPNYYLLLDSHHDRASSAAMASLNAIKGQHAIGVVYDPNHESRNSYVPTSLANRYDALVFFDHTNALTPLNVNFDRDRFPETYPHGSRV